MVDVILKPVLMVFSTTKTVQAINYFHKTSTVIVFFVVVFCR